MYIYIYIYLFICLCISICLYDISHTHVIYILALQNNTNGLLPIFLSVIIVYVYGSIWK